MKVAAVIPAYNEAATIGAIVAVLVQCPEVHEVVVVSDGSEDGTAEVARRAGARVVELPVNRGKGAAMKVGFDATSADVVLFIDADLIGLQCRHVRMLVEPVTSRRAQTTVGVFEGGRVTTDLALAVAPFLSGQRAVRRELLATLPESDWSGYGIEVALTRHFKRIGCEVQEVTLPDLTQRMKEEKHGLWRGLARRAKMYWEIVRAVPRR